MAPKVLGPREDEGRTRDDGRSLFWAGQQEQEGMLGTPALSHAAPCRQAPRAGAQEPCQARAATKPGTQIRHNPRLRTPSPVPRQREPLGDSHISNGHLYEHHGCVLPMCQARSLAPHAQTSLSPTTALGGRCHYYIPVSQTAERRHREMT